MNFKKIYEQKAIQADEWFNSYAETCYVNDENSKYYGSMATFCMLPETAEIGLIAAFVTVYCCKQCKNYKNKKILEHLDRAIKSLKAKLNDDGTNTMYQSNFHTGEQFGLASTASHLLIFKKYLSDDEYENIVFDDFCDMVEFMAYGCLNGGFHTPNHRWVESEGLLLAYKALSGTKHEKYLDKIMDKAKRYLAEGVDCDEYGEWSERSAGMYNAHCDNAFLQIYSVLPEEEYLDCVYRNLMLVRYYIDHDDYSLFTQNSRRNDKGELGSVQLFNKGRKFYADQYTRAYLLTAYFKNDSYLASIAYSLIEKSREKGRGDGLPLEEFLIRPEIIDWEFKYEKNPLPKVYENYLPKSHIVRKRDNIASYTFLARNPTFMFIDAPGLNVRMRLCSSFFAIAQFVPKTLEKTDDGYVMEYTAIADYKLPLENPDGITTKDYWSIDYSKRGSIQKQTFVLKVELKFKDYGFDLNVSSSGTDKVPTKLEIFVNENLHLETNDSILVTKANGNFLSKGSNVRLESEAGTIMEIEGMFAKHLYIDMRGSLDPIQGMFNLVSTDFAPFERSLKFKLYKRDGIRLLF